MLCKDNTKEKRGTVLGKKFPSRYLCFKSEDKLHLGIKNERVHFILPSVCIIFANFKK